MGHLNEILERTTYQAIYEGDVTVLYYIWGGARYFCLISVEGHLTPYLTNCSNAAAPQG
jgi:hypothetical protein